jgi:hypothetical protein
MLMIVMLSQLEGATERQHRNRLPDCILGNFDENEARRLAGAVNTYESHRPRTKYKA